MVRSSQIFSHLNGGSSSNRYISAGRGNGSPYGLAAVLAVCYPFFFYARLYWPGPPMTNIIFFVTTVLVSW